MGSKLQLVELSPFDVRNVCKSITGSHAPSAPCRQQKPTTPALSLPSPPLGLVPFDIVVPATNEDMPTPPTVQYTVRHMRPLSLPSLRNASRQVDTSRGISSLAPLGITDSLSLHLSVPTVVALLRTSRTCEGIGPCSRDTTSWCSTCRHLCCLTSRPLASPSLHHHHSCH